MFPVYGQGENITRLIPQMTQAIMNNKIFYLNNPDALIDYSNIDDVVKLIYKAVNYLYHTNKSFEEFHLATGECTSLKDFAFNHWCKLGGKINMFKINKINDNVYHHISNIKSIFKP